MLEVSGKMGHLKHLGSIDKCRATDVSDNVRFTALPSKDIVER